jgi:signal transduction histidine kinase
MAAPDIPTGRASQITLPTRPPEACTVLIVDDDERILEYFGRILSRDGYRIVTASNGFEALARVQDSEPDVVVLDVIIPGLNGIEVCERIKQDEGTRFLPVILVTAATDRDRRVEGLVAGADEFLDKSFQPLDLSVRVRTLLRTKQLYDEVEAQRRQLEQRVEQRTQELRAANERLEELNKVKGRVLAVVSHELRTPAMQVRTAVNSLREPGASPEQQAVLWQHIDEAFARLEHRLGEIREFSDPLALKLSLTSVADVVRGAVGQVHRLWPAEMLRIRLDVPPGLPPVEIDSQKMIRVLTRLIDNAVKFGEGQPVDVVTSAVNGYVTVAIRDYGPGIRAEDLPRLFMPLEQGDNSSTREHGGSGMGLSLARMILEAHGVELHVETEPGHGSTFWFALPVAEF